MHVDRSLLVERVRAAVSEGVIAVYLFGSHAAGRAHRESDVDVAVLLDRRRYRTRDERFGVRLLLAGLGPVAGSQPDVVILNDVAPHLARRIMTEGERLFCASDEQEHAARRTVLSRAADLEPFLRRMRALKLHVLRQ